MHSTKVKNKTHVHKDKLNLKLAKKKRKNNSEMELYIFSSFKIQAKAVVDPEGVHVKPPLCPPPSIFKYPIKMK